MSDWPSYPGLRRPHLTVSNVGDRCAAPFLIVGACPGLASAAWPSASRAVFYPISLDTPFIATRMFWVNGGTVSGHVDAGIYDGTGHLLASTGSTTQTPTSNTQSAGLTSSVELAPGSYYLAFSMDNTTGTLYRAAMFWSTIADAGAASAFPLPAAPTLTNWAYDYYMVLGMSSVSIP